MAKTKSAEGPSSEVLIAGKTYRLEKGAGTVGTLPKGASCGNSSRALPKGASCGNAALPKRLNR